MSNLQTYYHVKLDFQNMDEHTGGKWLIHGTKRRKDSQFQRIFVYGNNDKRRQYVYLSLLPRPHVPL